MADITHHFPIFAPIDKVFRAFSTLAGLDQWWTKTSSGEAREGVGDNGRLMGYGARIACAVPKGAVWSR